MKVFLIGMPASGKSTLGRELAAQLSLPFVDLDKEIEGAKGKTISELFLVSGEAGFRKMEAQTLDHWISTTGDFIMATGGGTPCFDDNMDKILGAGISIFIDVPVDDLVSRMSDEEKKVRPLLNTENSLEENLVNLRNNRLPYYERANLRITPATTADELVKMLA